MLKKKVLLMGRSGSGKTSMRSIIFANYLARDTAHLAFTVDVEHSHVRFLGNLVLNLWDCIAAGTPVPLLSGVSVPIEHVKKGMNIGSFMAPPVPPETTGKSHNPAPGRAVCPAGRTAWDAFAKGTAKEDRPEKRIRTETREVGVRPCVKVICVDYSELVCTPDHRILVVRMNERAQPSPASKQDVITTHVEPATALGCFDVLHLHKNDLLFEILKHLVPDPRSLTNLAMSSKAMKARVDALRPRLSAHLLDRAQFIRAKDLRPRTDFVVTSSMSAVPDDPAEDGGSGAWEIAGLRIPGDRMKIEALGRLMGHVATCGSLGEGCGHLVLGHHFDVAQAQADIQLLGGTPGAVQRRDGGDLGSTFNVDIPTEVERMLRQAGAEAGSVNIIPAAVLDESAPKCFVREWLAAAWGGGGSKPRTNGHCDLSLLSSMSISEELFESADDRTSDRRVVAHDESFVPLVQLLRDRFGIESRVVSSFVKSKKPGQQPGNFCHVSGVRVGNGKDSRPCMDWHDRIGIRYCVDKLVNLDVWHRWQRCRSPDAPGKNELRGPSAECNYGSFCDMLHFVRGSGRRENSTTILVPVAKVLGADVVGSRPVYDITMEGDPNFVAGGFTVHNCGGQDAYMDSYFNNQKDQIFRNVQVLIYLFDIESREHAKDLRYYRYCLEALLANSKDAAVFCLVHKMDLVPEDQRDQVFRQKETELKQVSLPLKVTCYATSIWDATLYKAWSSIVYSLIPNIRTIERHLDQFCAACEADEVVMFESATFLEISHATRKEHPDIHRFEQISNIIKQFKLSCSKAATQLHTIQVHNPFYDVFVTSFTATTFIMVVVSDPSIQPALTLANIDNARAHFEQFSKQD